MLYLATNLADSLLIGAFADDGVYVALGKALADGRGYHAIHILGAPVEAKYPPLFPLFLAALWRLGGSVGAVQQLVAVIHPIVVGLTAGLMWWIGRRHLAAPRSMLAILVALPFAFDAAITYYTIPLSEPWFMLGWATVIALWFALTERSAQRISGDAQQRESLAGLCAAIGLVAAATVLVRTQAIVLMPATGVALLAARLSGRERFAAVAGMAVPLAGWFAYHTRLLANGVRPTGPDEGSYISWFTDAGSDIGSAMARVIGNNVRNYVGDIGAYLSGVTLIGVIAASVVMAGLVVASGASLRRIPALATSVLGTIALVLLWPFSQDRLMLSVLPFAGLAACAVLAPLSARSSLRVRRAAPYLAGVAVVLVLVRQLDVRREATSVLQGTPRTFFTPLRILLSNSRFVAHTSQWARLNISNDDRLMVDGSAGVYLYSGRASVQYSPTLNGLAPPPDDVPGQYLARRIVADTLDYIVASSTPEFAGDVLEVNTRCSGSLTPAAGVLPEPLVALKVRRDMVCIRRMSEEGESGVRSKW